MNSILLQLIALSPFTIAMRAIDNGMGAYIAGPEEVVTDFAVLSGSNLDQHLPDDITICSSVTTGGAWTAVLSPFQLMGENGEPWISFIFNSAGADVTRLEIWLYVSM